LVFEQPILGLICLAHCSRKVNLAILEHTKSTMEPEFVTYQKFNDAALAKELTTILDENHIEYYLQEESSGFDPSMVMSNAPVDYAVKIKSSDFERVTQLLVQNEEQHVDEVDNDYYLFGFTNDELLEVITKADEWSVFDVVLARKILTERGITINERQLTEKKEERITELKVVKALSTSQLVVCYIFAIGGGLIGIPIGWLLITSKKTLPDGEQVYAYSENDRWHGRMIFYISIVDFVLALLYKFGVIL